MKRRYWYHSNPELHMFRRRHAVWTWFYVASMYGMGVFQAWHHQWWWVAFSAWSVWKGVRSIRDDMRTWPRFTE